MTQILNTESHAIRRWFLPFFVAAAMARHVTAGGVIAEPKGDPIASGVLTKVEKNLLELTDAAGNEHSVEISNKTPFVVEIQRGGSSILRRGDYLRMVETVGATTTWQLKSTTVKVDRRGETLGCLGPGWSVRPKVQVIAKRTVNFIAPDGTVEATCLATARISRIARSKVFASAGRVRIEVAVDESTRVSRDSAGIHSAQPGDLIRVYGKREGDNIRAQQIFIEIQSRPPASATTKDPPDEAEVRTWTDVSGKYEIRATFAGYLSGEVKLVKTNGEIINVPFEQLSAADQRFIKDR
jgi:hypothetical protein